MESLPGSSSPVRWICAGLLALLALAPGAPAAPPSSCPAAGEILWPAVSVRAEPDAAAERIAVLRQFRRDFRARVVLALAARTDTDERLWYRISLPGWTSERTGWVRAEAVEVEPIAERIVIRRGARILELYRGERLLLRTRVVVGAPGMETPLGRFYITAKFRPRVPLLGRYALETSAYSKLSEWPGGRIVGIHGTNQPWLLGQAVSHGCVRVSNAAVLRLKQLVPLGTPVRIVR